MNATENIIALFFIGLMLMAFFMTYSIGNELFRATDEVMNATLAEQGLDGNNTMSNAVRESYVESIDSLYNGITFLIYIAVGVSLFSSFIQQNTLQEYLLSFMSSILAGALVVYSLTYVYNQFVVSLSAYPGIFDIDQMYLFFFSNFSSLVFANIVAMLLGFIFVRKGVQPA